jgi:hypothetical protein
MAVVRAPRDRQIVREHVRRCGLVCETMTTSRQGSRHGGRYHATGFPESRSGRTQARTAHGEDRDASSRCLYSVVQGARALTSKDGG